MTATVELLAQAAASAGDKTAVNVGGKTPFLPGRKARVIFHAVGNTGTAPAYAVDGSDDNSTWTADIATSAVQDGTDAMEVTCYKYMRASVTTESGTAAGTLSVRLEGIG